MRRSVLCLCQRMPLWAASLAALLACGGGDPATSPGLPPEGDGGSTTGDGGGGAGTSWTGGGTGGGPARGDDEVPGHLLTLRQEGTWTLSPATPPYDSLTGTLTLTELLDGEQDVPACTATFALTGTASDERCDGCTAGFQVLHYLSQDGASLPGPDSGAPIEVPGLSGCLGTDLPAHEEVWVMALASDRIERRLGLSTWQAWYDAQTVAGTVTFSWTATVAVEGDEEDVTE